ncbi:TPA: transposase [Legionella pneumophila]|nr:transposase [Legionella pneumophila]
MSICAIRWFVEQFHREVKQLTGIDKCQYRKQRIQRNQHCLCDTCLGKVEKYCR